MGILIKILQFLLSFSLLVIIHEAGHFMFAKLFGVRVEQFQLFFGRPWVSVVRGGTRYGIGWFPFGGFVKLAGMIDESMDTGQLRGEPKPDEFRSKPAWQRLLIMIGGVLMNIVLAFVIYVGMCRHWGEAYLATEDMRYGYIFSPGAERMGFRDGDRILTVDGVGYADFRQLWMALIINQEYEVVAVRDGDTVRFRTPAVPVNDIAADETFIAPRYTFLVGEVLAGSGAQKAGMLPGDRLVALDGRPVEMFDEYVGILGGRAGDTVRIDALRGGRRVVLDVEVSPEGKMGATVDMASLTPVHTRSYTFLESIPAGWRRLGSEIGGYWKQLRLVFRPQTEAYKSLGGPLAIGNIFPSQWNWRSFWDITALLSVILAVMNMLPIPALDGGHVLFLLVEVVTGRKPGDKFLIAAQTVGMILLLILVVYATGNDIQRIFFKR